MTAKNGKKLRVIMLVDEGLAPSGSLQDMAPKKRELHKTEFHVKEAIEALAHEVWPIEVGSDLNAVRGAIDAHKPDVAFNLIEEFAKTPHFDAHVVSYLELRGQAYTGCNPRGLMIARDKALTKKILGYHGIDVPGFAVFPPKRKVKAPDNPPFPLFVKSLTMEGSSGISGASVVRDEKALAERVEYIHRETDSPAIAEQFIEGREIYVGVYGNDRLVALPPWELSMKNLDPDKPLIAGDRAKWDPEYQKKMGLVNGPAELDEKARNKFEEVAKQTYRLLYMSGYARLDYRLAEDGRMYLLEANPNPQIARDEDFAESAAHAGTDYEALIQKIVMLGMNYDPSRLEIAA